MALFVKCSSISIVFQILCFFGWAPGAQLFFKKLIGPQLQNVDGDRMVDMFITLQPGPNGCSVSIFVSGSKELVF